MPLTMNPEHQAAQRAYMRYHNMNPIFGISSRYVFILSIDIVIIIRLLAGFGAVRWFRSSRSAAWFFLRCFVFLFGQGLPFDVISCCIAAKALTNLPCASAVVALFLLLPQESPRDGSVTTRSWPAEESRTNNKELMTKN